jgi:hypothetical protein
MELGEEIIEPQPVNKGNIFLSKNSSSPGVPQRQVYYVGKHGSNSNNGLTINTALLTFTQAINLATLQSPSSNKRFVIICLDPGVYAENITTVQWVDIYAPNAVVEGFIALADNVSVTFHRIQTTGSAVVKAAGSGISHVIIEHIQLNSSADFTMGIANLSPDGIIIARVEKIICNAPFTIAVFSNSPGAGYIDFQIDSILLNSESTFGLAAVDNGKLYGSVNQIIVVTDSSLNTFGIYTLTNGVVDVNCRKIDASTAILVNPSSVCSVFVNELLGAVIGLGTLHLAEAKNSHTPVFKQLSADPPDPAEGQSIMWMSDGTGSGDAGDIMIKITSAGITKTGTLVDFSAL